MTIKHLTLSPISISILLFCLTPSMGLCQDEAGCTDPVAINYNPYIQEDDGSCLYAGCMNELACNYDPEADVNGLCDYPGCADPEANNYDPDASCFDEEVCDYNDNDLVIHSTYAIHEGIVGAVNLSGYITSRVSVKIGPDDQFSAIYGLLEDDNLPDESDITIVTECGTFEETMFGGFLGRDHSCDLYGIYPELEYDSYLTINQSSSCDAGNTYIAVSEPLDYDQGNIGDLFIDDGAVFVIQAAANSWPDENGHVFIAQLTTCGDFAMSFCIQYYIDADLANIATECIQCSFEFGCTDPLAPNFNPYANTDDGSCLPAMIAGCMNEEACNFDPEADLNTVCFYPECTDPLACNYVEAAFCEDQSTCIFFEAGSLDGPVQVEAGSSGTYTYNGEVNGNYTWEVDGGEILEYLENNQIVIQWGDAGVGSITIIDNDLDCPGSVGPTEITIEQVNSVSKLSEEGITVYPNPTSHLLYVEVPSSSVRQPYHLLDASGKLVRNGVLSKGVNEISVDTLPDGVYTLVIEGAAPTQVLIGR